MADPRAFYQTMVTQTNALVNLLQVVDTLQDRLAEDSTLAEAAAQAANAMGRTDLAAVDFTNAASAINQILFAFNSGSPTQKSYLYKLL